MAEDDYYKTLGVDKNASKDEIKRAYKKLARRYHPDNSETGDAEKFKKINEAASVLGDDSKRQRYDQFGPEGADFKGFDSSGFDFSSFASGFGNDFDDLFDHLGDIFGGSFGSRGRGGRRRQVMRGDDLRYDLEITLEEAAFGTTRKIEYNRLDSCKSCGGTGAEPGSGIITCPHCNGTGQIVRQQRTPFGIFQTATVCSRCKGEGTAIKEECRSCDGTGLVKGKKTLEVRIPSGVDSGIKLRIEGEGNAARAQGISGDLYVFIEVLSHKYFIRKNDDIYIDCPVSVADAALGTEIEVPTLTGKATLRIPPGTQPETIFRMREKGIHSLRSSHAGDELVKVKVEIPKSLSRKERQAFEELRSESKKSGFFDNLFK